MVSVASPAAAVAPNPKTRESACWRALRFARPDTQQIELQAGSYLFTRAVDALYVVRSGRLQILAGDGAKDEWWPSWAVVRWSEAGGAARCAAVRIGFVRYATRPDAVTKARSRIADAGVLGALAALANDGTRHAWPLGGQRRRSLSRSSVSTPMHRSQWWPQIVRARCRRGTCCRPGGRLRRVGTCRADRRPGGAACAAVGDAGILFACRRSRGAEWPLWPVPVAPLPTRSDQRRPGAGRPPARNTDDAWEQLSRRGRCVVRREFVATTAGARHAYTGRSVTLGQRACAHLVLEELEAAGVTVVRFAGTSMGAIIAALAASGFGYCRGDAQICRHFVRRATATTPAENKEG